MLHVNMTVGIIVKVTAAIMMNPWLIKHKIWDVVALQSIMAAIDLHKLVALLLL